MKLEDIGFYTLSDYRAANSSVASPLWRAELILTDRCNFRCPYCRGMRPEFRGDLPFNEVVRTLDVWFDSGLRNVRFSGGEPTVYKDLDLLAKMGRRSGVEHVAISTNGSASADYYKHLVDCGVNDFSISLDACCASTGDMMAGNVPKAWKKTVENIRLLSELTYVTVGVVITEDTMKETTDIIRFASGLGVADIRVIPSAQYNAALGDLAELEQSILDKHPILKYRVRHFREGRHVRGIQETDCHRCWLAADDVMSAGGKHFPCIIHFREGGDPIGDVGPTMRQDRMAWLMQHNSYEDPICRKNCLDVCIDYNNKADLRKK